MDMEPFFCGNSYDHFISECLIIEDRFQYKRWKEQTLAYYAANAVKCTEPEELDRDELIARRTELLEKEYGKSESNE